MQIQLTPEELELLRDVLAREVSNIKEEIYKTDTREVKEMLKQREATLVSLRDRLRSPTAA